MTVSTGYSHYSASIVICSKGRHSFLSETLKLLERFCSNDILVEVVVVEETDVPQPIVERKVQYYPIPIRNLGLGFARNYGLKRARGSIIIFVDDDIVPGDGWLERLLAPFEDPEVGAVGGAILADLSDINTVGRCVSFLGFPAGGLGRILASGGKPYETQFISTGNCAFRADMAKRAGGFDEFLRWWVEDTDFFQRMAATCRAFFVPDAIVFHKQRSTLKGVFRWFIRRGIGDFTLQCKRSHPFLALCTPVRSNFFLKLGILASFLGGVASRAPLSVIILLPVIIFLWNYALWTRGLKNIDTRLSESRDPVIEKARDALMKPGVKQLLFIVKFCMDFGHMIGNFVGFLRYLNHRLFEKPFILTFHNLTSDSRSQTNPFSYGSDQFRSLLSALEKGGRYIVPLSDLVTRLQKSPNSLYLDRICAITFDDGYQSICEPLRRLAAECNYVFTIFVATGLVGGLNTWDVSQGLPKERLLSWEELKGLAEVGVQIGSHTRTHTHLASLTSEEKDREISQSAEEIRLNISEQTGHGILFSYPYGEVDQESVDLTRQAGYLGALANFPGTMRPGTDRFRIPRIPVRSDTNYQEVCRLSRSHWFRELLKDIRDYARQLYIRSIHAPADSEK